MTSPLPDAPSNAPPPAEGARVAWSDVPEPIRRALETWAGASVTSAESQRSGFSPGAAARLLLSDGRRFFVKAAGPVPNPLAPAFHRREAGVVTALPEELPVPRLKWVFDDVHTGWVLLVFDDVDGVHPGNPWTANDLGRVLAGLAELASGLTPSPLPIGKVHSASEMLATRICGWQRLRRAAEPKELNALDAWSRAHLDQLADLEEQAPAAVAGQTLLHFDVRADNILLTPERVWFFDWPHASVGAAWLDVVGFAPSVRMQGGPAPEEIVERYPESRKVDPRLVTAAVAAIAGYFVYQSLQSPPAGLPTLRAFQAAQGDVAVEWLKERTRWT
jgi:aminoglycoside phosphotransferase (APT) family kinase protein